MTEEYIPQFGTYRVKKVEPSTQRKPEIGERLDGTAKKTEPGKCYICRARNACVYFSAVVPKCVGCYERFRRKSK